MGAPRLRRLILRIEPRSNGLVRMTDERQRPVASARVLCYTDEEERRGEKWNLNI